MEQQSVLKKPVDEKGVKTSPILSKSDSSKNTNQNQQQSNNNKNNNNNNNAIPTKPNCQSALISLSDSNYASFDCDTCYALPRTPRTSSWISSERLNELRKKVQEAIKAHKIFTVRGCFHTVRRSMAERNWVEKLDSHRKMYGNNASGILIDELVQNLPQRRPGESKRAFIAKCERNIMSRFLEHVTVDLLWTARREKSDWLEMSKNQVMLINRFSKAPFTSKEGLCAALKEFYWFYEEGTSETYFPRCYNVWKEDELSDFTDDFRLTACVGLLKWLICTFYTSGVDGVSDIDGKVPITCLNFALMRCREYLDSKYHCDIDTHEEPAIWEFDYDVFLTHHYLLTHEGAKLKLPEVGYAFDSMLADARHTLDEIKKFCPQYSLDGYLNIWIIKPGNKCRGRGIILMNNIKQITSMVNPPIVTKTRYVVQKYIERPLIIYETKFDLRQWFLVTSVQPLIIWFYKDSYLRFSSQQYTLYNYDQSIHLTNYAIQKKYSLCSQRDIRLPTENMWDCHTFQAYLRQIGKPEMWHDRIYPGMQKAIIGSMLACQDNMDRRPNTFELFGADFMISEDFYPWLIEINSSPDLAPSTSVTARLCPQCVEDSIKVVVDRKFSPDADTGAFVQIYKQIIPKTPAYMGLNLALRGHRIVPKSNKKDRIRISPNRSLQSFISLTRANSPLRAKQHSPVIMDLIDCLNLKSKYDQDNEENTKKFKRDLVYKRPITLSSLSRARVGQRRSLLRHEPEQDDVIKTDFVSRRISSLSKLHIQATDEGVSCVSDSDQTTQNNINNIKEFICLGNKLNDNSLELEKPNGSQSNLNLTSIVDNSPTDESKPVPFHKCKNIESDISTIRAKIRKFPSSNRPSSSVSQTEAAENSHFYAVGLSLKAWRAKYNCILKAKKELFQNETHIPATKMTLQKTRKKSPRSSPIRLRLLMDRNDNDDDLDKIKDSVECEKVADIETKMKYSEI